MNRGMNERSEVKMNEQMIQSGGKPKHHPMLLSLIASELSCDGQ